MQKISKIKWKLKHNAGQLDIYVIMLATGNDLLEIMHCAYLQQTYYKKTPPFIVGVAKGYNGALELVEEIVQDTYEQTGDYKVKDFIKSKS